jgi:hypothetical protein
MSVHLVGTRVEEAFKAGAGGCLLQERVLVAQSVGGLARDLQELAWIELEVPLLGLLLEIRHDLFDASLCAHVERDLRGGRVRVSLETGGDAGRGDPRRHGVDTGRDELVHAVAHDGVPEGHRVGEQALIDEVLLDLVHGLAGLDDELDLLIAGSGRGAHAIGELGREQVRDEGQVDDARVLLEQALHRWADHGAGGEPAADDHEQQGHANEDEALERT